MTMAIGARPWDSWCDEEGVADACRRECEVFRGYSPEIASSYSRTRGPVRNRAGKSQRRAAQNKSGRTARAGSSGVGRAVGRGHHVSAGSRRSRGKGDDFPTISEGRLDRSRLSTRQNAPQRVQAIDSAEAVEVDFLRRGDPCLPNFSASIRRAKATASPCNSSARRKRRFRPVRTRASDLQIFRNAAKKIIGTLL
jgi:hypothetical protein